MPITLDDLRRFAVRRSLFAPTTLQGALDLLGFVQADPIRAPARAQDLMLRHRVEDYRAGDLERRYAELDVEEDTFINYGFVTGAVHALMHPRAAAPQWPPTRRRQAQSILQFVRERGVVHPREVNNHFSHGTTRNYWGGTSNATTHLLDAMHYRGLLRVASRAGGIRLYTAREPVRAEADRASVPERIDALVDVLVRQYAPLPGASLSMLVSRLRYCVPQWKPELKDALRRARQRLSHAPVEGTRWYWPAEEDPTSASAEDRVRLLAPFDPVVWDRRRFELFWGWAYRFEAYTPITKRKLGYYALPLLWRDRVIGWANLTVCGDKLQAGIGYVAQPPSRDRLFRGALAEELERMRVFLGLTA